MPETVNLFLGFDPGGKGNFGWSICWGDADQLEPPAKTGLANDAWDALNRVKCTIESLGLRGNSRVLATGIDAPLFWGAKGNRTIDQVLRDALKGTGFPPQEVGGTIQEVNSLQGACVVQGTLLAMYLNETPCRPKVTESHPKALRHLLARTGKHQDEHQMAEHLIKEMTTRKHELDATLAAVSAWAAIHHRRSGKWQNLYGQEPCPITPFNIPVSYWMPVPP